MFVSKIPLRRSEFSIGLLLTCVWDFLGGFSLFVGEVLHPALLFVTFYHDYTVEESTRDTILITTNRAPRALLKFYLPCISLYSFSSLVYEHKALL